MDTATALDLAMRNYQRGGISQVALSKLSGVSQGAISKALKGKTVPDLATLRKLAEALNVTVESLSGSLKAAPVVREGQLSPKTLAVALALESLSAKNFETIKTMVFLLAQSELPVKPRKPGK